MEVVELRPLREQQALHQGLRQRYDLSSPDY